MKIVGYHIQDNYACNSDGETSKDILPFLLQQKDDSIKVFYNLDWAVARLCYLINLPENLIKRLWDTGELYFQGYRFYFIPHRYLNIKYGKYWGESSFSDIYQYDVTLPFEIDGLEAAKKAQEIGSIVYETMDRIGLHPKTLSSPVSAFQKEILNTIRLPTNDDLPPEVSLYAYKCLHGGWQECFKKGHYYAYDYDMVSAYSYFTAQLLDHRYGEWVKSTVFHESQFGYWKGIVDIWSDFSPIIFKNDNDSYTPTGQWITYLTNNEIKLIEKYNLGKFRIIDGWHWNPNTQWDIPQPLRENIDNLYEWKRVLKGLPKDVVKRILVGSWGKTQEVFHNGELGNMFNPVWASEIESNTRLKVADFILSNNAQVISIAVDGCLLDRKVNAPNVDEMGTWRQELEGNAFVISAGIGAVQGKKNKGAFSLNYDWLKSEIEKDGTKSQYILSKKTPVTIGNAIKNHKLDKLGELEETQRAVIIDLELKRMFKGLPLCGNDLLNNKYESLPLDISYFEVEKEIEKYSTIM